VLVAPTRRGALRRRLLAWYDASARVLPWRVAQRGADPYRVWLAEAMLQQTQVARVIPFYRRFLARLPTLEALAAAPEDEVLALWSGLGYYARARSLRRAAQLALARHGGLPAELQALRALPGFGPYTAGAVASIAFAVPAPAVDGNVARVLSRLFLVEGRPEAPATRDRLWALAGALVDPVRPGDWNQALIELGATRCLKPAPDCARCPVAALCLARRAGRERELPPPRLRPSRARVRLVCAHLTQGGRVLLVRRPGRGLFAGLWALPAFEVASRSEPAAALGRMLRVSLGAGVRVGPLLGAVRRTLTHRDLELLAFQCEGGRLRRSSQRRWVGLADLDRLGVPSAFRALLAQAARPRRKGRGPLGNRTDLQ
jgi:A/G-specific adenine glycosylase